MPRRILHLITTTQVGGAETQLLRLVEGGSPEFHHVVVSLAPPGPLAAPLTAAGAEVLSLGLAPSPAALPLGIWRLRGLVRRLRPALVQGWMYHANLLAVLAGGPGRRPVLWGIRCTDMEFARYGLATRLVAGACARLARRPRLWVANSQAGADHHAARGYPAAGRRVIPNGFDTARFRPDPAAREAARAELCLAAGELLVGLVARYDLMKDQAGFLQAAARLAARRPGVRFACLGQGMVPGNPALAAAALPPLAGRVALLGRREDVPRLLNALDLHVSASAFGEGLSNAVGEAMACGVVNLVTDVGDSALLVGDTGLVVPPKDPAALAEGLAALLALPPAERAARGAAARRRIAEHYSLAAMVAAYQELYRELLG